MGVFQFLIQQFYHNQFMAAAVVAAPMTAIVYIARNVPVKIWHFVKRQLTTEIGFNSDIPDYLSAQEFVAKNVVSDSFSRTFLYSSDRRWEQGDEVIDFRGLTLGYGAHIGTWKRRLVWITRTLEQGQQTDKFKERLTLTFVTRKQRLVAEFARDVREYGERAMERDSVPLWINSGGWWGLASRLPHRSLATIFTANNEGEALLSHIRSFEGKRDWYRRRGIPYHTGILLTGEPGTGKTSLIHALASETKRTLHYLNLGSVESDSQLTNLVSSGRGWGRSILVIEDADASRADVSRDTTTAAGKECNPVTLSALLNLLDGLLTPDGLIVIATSNHPNRLDDALVRPGRFDVNMELGKLNRAAFERMADTFGVDVSSADFEPLPGAELRARLLEKLAA